MHTLYDYATDAVRFIYDRRLVAPPVLDGDTCFPHRKLFADNWQAIRDEALSIMENLSSVPRFHEIMREQEPISANDGKDWRMYILKAYGVKYPKHLGACPALAGLLHRSPEVLSAALSFMAPGKHIPEHRGPFRGILRYYLVLSMPRLADGRPAASLKVAGTEYALDEGKDLLWDDTFPHEVHNRGDTTRTVLLLDVRRPDMPVDLRWLSQSIVTLIATSIRVRRLNAAS